MKGLNIKEQEIFMVIINISLKMTVNDKDVIERAEANAHRQFVRAPTTVVTSAAQFIGAGLFSAVLESSKPEATWSSMGLAFFADGYQNEFQSRVDAILPVVLKEMQLEKRQVALTEAFK